MNFVAFFFTGAFLCNAIPHLSSGLSGKPFPTPFARPRGKGDSPPWVNFLWGFFNLMAGLLLLARYPVAIGFNAPFITLALGALALGTHLSRHFAKVRRERSAK